MIEIQSVCENKHISNSVLTLLKLNGMLWRFFWVEWGRKHRKGAENLEKWAENIEEYVEMIEIQSVCENEHISNSVLTLLKLNGTLWLFFGQNGAENIEKG